MTDLIELGQILDRGIALGLHQSLVNLREYPFERAIQRIQKEIAIYSGTNRLADCDSVVQPLHPKGSCV